MMNNSEINTSIFPKGEKAAPDYFVGTAYVNPLVPNDPTLHIQVWDVVFEAGARNNWHTHAGGQILMATKGVGYYQEKGKPIQVLRQGDVVNVPPNVKHWHGASPDCEFTHIAINPNTQDGVTVWLEPVTDEEYNNG